MREQSRIQVNLVSNKLSYESTVEASCIDYQALKFVVQSTDEEADRLLQLTNEQLGQMMRDTWITGQYRAYKRMLLRHQITTHHLNWRILTVEEQVALLYELEAALDPDYAAPSATSPIQVPRPPSGPFFRVQSKDEAVGMLIGHEGENRTETQNVSFLDSNLGSEVKFDPISDTTMFQDATPGVELGEYLSRPVLVQTINWSAAMVPGSLGGFDPWYEFFNSTPIKKKLDNYANLSCNLKVKFVVNASPFLFGSVLVHYYPLPGLAQDMVVTTPNGYHLMQYTQRPHLWILPQTCHGGDLSLPFFYHKNWLNATSATDLRQMGTLNYDIVNILDSANGAVGSSVVIQVYAWAENVKLMGPTIGLAVQSKDEYGQGVISKPASAIAEATGLLSNVPVIGPYMTATSIASRAVARIAHMFGYTNVPVISNVHALKPQPFPHMASPEISTPVEKLVLDPKNELTIDPRTVGLPGRDELDIQYLCSREALVTSCVYDTSMVADDILFSSLVKPCIHYTESIVAHPHVYTVPMAYIQAMFTYWRGDIIFRFRFICTQYHKGRVRVSYDPNSNISTAGNANNYSTVFNKIIDIGCENDFEIRVPYMQALAWLTTDRTFTNASICWAQNNVLPNVHNATTDNGTITLRVVTPLTAPVASSSTRIQIFVRAADNFELALPRDLPQATLFSVQSQDEPSFDKPEQVIAGNSAGHKHPQRYLVNMGEVVKSLRHILRRSVYSVTLVPTSDTGSKHVIYRHIHSRFPLYYGYDPNGINTANKVATVGTAPFNFTKVTPYNWIAPMFMGQRGSMIWNVNVDSFGTGAPISSIAIKRIVATGGASVWSNTIAQPAALSVSSDTRFLNLYKGTGCAGMTLTNQITQSGVAASYPNYNMYRFQFINPNNVVAGNSVDGSLADFYQMEVDYKPLASGKNVNNVTIDKYVSIGTDFTLFFFISTPTFQLLSTVPTAP